MTNQIDQQEPPADWGKSENSNTPELKTLHITKENKCIYIIAVSALAIIAVVSTFSICILSYQGKNVPGALIGLCFSTISTLAVLFTKN